MSDPTTSAAGRTANSVAPPWWPPRGGDVAVFLDCVDGGMPYRVCVSYNYAERAWMNVATGGILPRQPYPGDLVMLVRDGERYAD